MEYSVVILSVCVYVESRVKTGLDRRELIRSIGYSYPHIRKIFRDHMRIPLARYILLRRLNYAAFELIHTGKNLLEIATDYGFEQYDAFTRAFKRETGITPSEFRIKRLRAGRRLIASGVYAPAILDIPSPSFEKSEVFMNQKQKDNCILFGVPKVEYKWEECTPFPSCLKACLNYIGQDISYAYLMAASGAAFRLRWNKKFWDGGNVDISYIYDDALEAYRRSFEAAGRGFRFLKREESDKKGFIAFIKSEIGKGRPVIALGIIGPPEACIITGYQDDGDTLLGWNFFQSRPEYNKDVTFHDCGYFICRNWWENECTNLLMSIGETQNAPVSDKLILRNALEITIRGPITWDECDNEVACGQDAYKIWAEWTESDKYFGESITLPLLCEHFMCQTDAQCMTGEGRWYANEYLRSVAKRHPEVSNLCGEAAEYFIKVSKLSEKMDAVIGPKEPQEAMLRRYAQRETRLKIVELIREAAVYEASALELIGKIADLLPEKSN